MVAEKIASGMHCQRRDPELGFHARAFDRLDERDHVGIAARELRGVEIPVAHRSLPAVVEHRPAEPELLRLGQGTHHLIHGEITLIAPGTPDRLVGRRGHLRLSHPALGEKFAISVERREIIAAMNGHEGLEGRKALARRQRRRVIAFDRDARTGCRHRERQRKEPRHCFDMADRQSAIAPPDIHHRRAAAIVRCIHAHEVALIEARTQRLHPVPAILMRCA